MKELKKNRILRSKKKTAKHEFSDSPNNFGLQEYGSAWALIENILLAATYEGLGTGIHVPVNKEYQQIRLYVRKRRIPAGDLETYCRITFSSFVK